SWVPLTGGGQRQPTTADGRTGSANQLCHTDPAPAHRRRAEPHWLAAVGLVVVLIGAMAMHARLAIVQHRPRSGATSPSTRRSSRSRSSSPPAASEGTTRSHSTTRLHSPFP